MIASSLVHPNGIADIFRDITILVGGVSWGMGVAVLPQIKKIWTREDLVTARTFLIVHLLVVIYVFASLAEHAGEPMSWRIPLALVIFALKMVMLAWLRERVSGRDLRANPPSRRAADLADDC